MQPVSAGNQFVADKHFDVFAQVALLIAKMLLYSGMLAGKRAQQLLNGVGPQLYLALAAAIRTQR